MSSDEVMSGKLELVQWFDRKTDKEMRFILFQKEFSVCGLLNFELQVDFSKNPEN